MKTRLYSLVAHHYLSPLQCGLQTAHAIAELSVNTYQNMDLYHQWARDDKTIIILGASNHAGVENACIQFQRLATKIGLPFSIFYEDRQSMNEMATATAIIVPEYIYDATVETRPETGEKFVYHAGAGYELNEYASEFYHFLKSFRLA